MSNLGGAGGGHLEGVCSGWWGAGTELQVPTRQDPLGQGAHRRSCGGRGSPRGGPYPPPPPPPPRWPPPPPATSMRAPGSQRCFPGLHGAPRSLPLLGSGSFPSSTQGCSEDHGQGARPVKAPSERSGSGFGLPRNVLSERERRWAKDGPGLAGELWWGRPRTSDWWL